MADVFISYKREDRAVAQRLAGALAQLGFEVWWDLELLAGDKFRKVIREVIDQCGAAIVLWSAKSVDSDFVIDEAGHALRRGRLCPVRIDAVELPFGFGQTHADDLSGWDGELTHAGFQALVRALEARTGRKARLGAGPRSAEMQALSAELQEFQAAQLAGGVAALRAFVELHPRGAFAAFVRGQIESMQADAASALPAAARHTPPAHAPAAAPLAQARPPRRVWTWVLLATLPVVVAAAVAYLMHQHAQQAPPIPALRFDLAGLDAKVRDSAERARDAERRARMAAAKARETAAKALAGGVQAPLSGLGYSGKPADPSVNAYAGSYDNGRYAGVGVLAFGEGPANKSNSLRYEGEFASGRPGGVGLHYWRSKNAYAGAWQGGERTGAGVTRFADGSRFEGEYQAGKRSGYGVLWNAQGGVAEAGWYVDGRLRSALAPQGR